MSQEQMAWQLSDPPCAKDPETMTVLVVEVDAVIERTTTLEPEAAWRG
jgi:hypothetical protein